LNTKESSKSFEAVPHESGKQRGAKVLKAGEVVPADIYCPCATKVSTIHHDVHECETLDLADGPEYRFPDQGDGVAEDAAVAPANVEVNT